MSRSYLEWSRRKLFPFFLFFSPSHPKNEPKIWISYHEKVQEHVYGLKFCQILNMFMNSSWTDQKVFKYGGNIQIFLIFFITGSEQVHKHVNTREFEICSNCIWTKIWLESRGLDPSVLEFSLSLYPHPSICIFLTLTLPLIQCPSNQVRLSGQSASSNSTWDESSSWTRFPRWCISEGGFSPLSSPSRIRSPTITHQILRLSSV